MAVRRESVLLEVEDHFTREILSAAAAAEALNRSLKSLSGSATTATRSISTSERDVDRLGKTSRRTGADINQLSGRLSILARVFATLGPAIAPVGAVGIAGIAGLASQLGFAATGALSLAVAARGVGDALEAVNAAAIEPTAANLEKAQQAMSKLAPEAQAFVMEFQRLRPVLGDLQRSAAAGWFPGLTEALGALESAAPRLERLLLALGTAGGDAVSGGASSLTGPRWAEFFSFVEREAPRAITDLSRAVGALAHGFAELWMAFDPINDGMRDWLLDVARSFDTWATGLDQTEGFADFLAYVNEMGPKVADAAGAIANAMIQIAQAAAPIGGPVLDGLTGVANAIALIADSPIGTPLLTAVTALSAMSLAARGADAAMTGIRANIEAINGPGASGASRLAATLLTISGSATLIQTAFEQIAGIRLDRGSLSRDLEALADGRITKNFDDLFHTFQDIDDLWMAKANPISWISSWDPTGAEAAQKNIRDIDAALAAMVEGGNAEMAADAWDELQRIGRDAGKSTSELTKLFPEYATALENTAPATDKAAGATERFSVKQEQARLAMLASRDAAVQSGRAFLNFSDSIAGEEFSLDAWLEAFEKQVRALANFQQNLQALRKRGLNDFALDELVKQGPAAAEAIDALANGGDAALERLNKASRKAGRELRQVGRDAMGAKADVDKLGEAKAEPKAELDKAPFDTKMGRLRDALSQTNNLTIAPNVGLRGLSGVEAQLRYLTRSRNMYINVISRRAPGDASLGGGRDTRGGSTARATGGAVFGPGTETSDSIPARLSHNEHVWTAAEVRAAGGHRAMERMRAAALGGDLPRFATGGAVIAAAGLARHAIPVSLPGLVATVSVAPTVATDPAILARLAAIESAVNRSSAVTRDEHATDRASQRSGASVAAMSKSRGYLPR